MRQPNPWTTVMCTTCVYMQSGSSLAALSVPRVRWTGLHRFAVRSAAHRYHLLVVDEFTG